MKRSNAHGSDSQSSSGDVHVVYVIISETADVNITGSIPCASVRVVTKPRICAIHNTETRRINI